MEYCCLMLTGAAPVEMEGRPSCTGLGWSVPLTLCVDRTLQQLPGSKERGAGRAQRERQPRVAGAPHLCSGSPRALRVQLLHRVGLWVQRHGLGPKAGLH